jgi:dihydrofolate reductase
MQKPIISMICAIAENRAIGKNNQLLWHIPDDFRHFKEITNGHAMIMGQKTFESIGKPLPNRTNIVITNDPNFKAEGCVICYSIDESLEKAKAVEKEEIFIIGGGSIYKQFIDKSDKLYLTIVSGEYEADTFFPDYSAFQKIKETGSGDDGKYKYKFLELER